MRLRILFNQIMKIPINSLADLGLLARATRKSNKLRLDDVAGSAGLGAVFVGDVEHGKETVQFGRVLKLLNELGIDLFADIPESSLAEVEKLKVNGLKPRATRASKKSTGVMK
jgi:transcriptional regulator with XRE-family HTH domain